MRGLKNKVLIILILTISACSEPVTYAPVKNVNQAIAPDNGYVKERLPYPAAINHVEETPSTNNSHQINHKPIENPVAIKSSVNNVTKKIPEDRNQPLAKPSIKSTKTAAESALSSKNTVKTPVVLSTKPSLAENQGLSREQIAVKPALKAQKSAKSGIQDTRGNTKYSIKSNRNTIFAEKNSVENAKTLDNLEITEKNIKKSIISIDNKKMLKLNFQWPLYGRLSKSFSQTDNKGIEISGNTGQTVVAAEAGKAVYCGHGLAGFGKVAIIKHNDTYLSAYANNSKLIVKEGQRVGKGQAIGQLGQTGINKAALHFEIRKNGRPINPLTLLPKN